MLKKLLINRDQDEMVKLCHGHPYGTNHFCSSICVLMNEFQNAGGYKTKFNAENLVSGIYFLRFNVNDKTVAVNKMMLIK